MDEARHEGFDNTLYIEQQSAEIMRRAEQFGKLYIEVGGKLFQDLHAARVLPGFDPDVKIRMMQKLADRIEVIVCVYAGDVENRKYRADLGTTYDSEVLRLIDEVRKWGLLVRGVVMTRFDPSMRAAAGFATKLGHLGVDVFKHTVISGYPDDIDKILCPAGCGQNAFVETHRPVVVVIAPGSSSGKLATCLNQLYHEHERGQSAGYAKYETFPIWNLPLDHPVNLAYEAATADLMDENRLDPFHKCAYGTDAVSYNRDIEAFPILQSLLSRVVVKDAYQSPTDMGVNRAGFAITNDAIVQQAARQEIIRRHFQAACDAMDGRSDETPVKRIDSLAKTLGINPEERVVVLPARRSAEEAVRLGKGYLGICCGAAIQLHDGTIITGKNSPMLHAGSSMILNALKHIAGLPDWLHLIPETYTNAIKVMKTQTFRQTATNLDVAELLIALGISSANSNAVQRAVDKLAQLRGCDVHLTHMVSDGDAAGLRRLGVCVTCDPQYPTKTLFVQ